MDRERVDAWLEAYRRAWEEADARAMRSDGGSVTVAGRLLLAHAAYDGWGG
jgi:hypothetical protein